MSWTGSELADLLRSECVRVLERLADEHAPGLRLPDAIAGQPVRADARADLLWTLHQLRLQGVAEIVGRPVEAVMHDTLAVLTPEGSSAFAAYRIAEVLAATPSLRDAMDHRTGLAVRIACDVSHLLGDVEGWLPRNYAPVVARAERARLAAGLTDDDSGWRQALASARRVLSLEDDALLDDDSTDAGRYDGYAIDAWLFAEPLREELGTMWDDGLRTATRLVDAVGHPGGGAVTWGRSSGPLAVAMTAQVAALALVRLPEGGERARWLARLLDVARVWPTWFDRGLCNAHDRAAQDGYRGPERRLQLTLDLLGKLAWSANTVRAAGDLGDPAAEPYAARDELISLGGSPTAAVWSHRGAGLDFVLPFVGPVRSHYLPGPWWPGVFELPCDQELVCWAPRVVTGAGDVYAGGGVPVEVEHRPGSVTARWHALPDVRGYLDLCLASLPGRRTTTFTVDGGALVMNDELELAESPYSLTLSIPETTTPLEVKAEGAVRVRRLDVSADPRWRSSWSQLQAVHEVELEPRAAVRYRVVVRPR